MSGRELEQVACSKCGELFCREVESGFSWWDPRCPGCMPPRPTATQFRIERVVGFVDRSAEFTAWAESLPDPGPEYDTERARARERVALYGLGPLIDPGCKS